MFWTFIAALIFVSIILPILFYLGILSIPIWGSLFSSIKVNKHTANIKLKFWTKVIVWLIVFVYTITLPKSDKTFKEALGWLLLLPIIWFVYSKIRDNLRIAKLNKQKRLESETTSISQ